MANNRIMSMGVGIGTLLMAQMAFGQPAWAPNTAYTVGDEVTYQETIYEAIQAHTSQLGWEPPNVPALWNRPAPPQGEVAAWTPNTVYPLGARAIYDAILYEARQAHTSYVGWEPPNAPALWQRPAEDGGVSEWVPQKLYHAGTMVTFDGQGYVARTDLVSQVGQAPPRFPEQWDFINIATCEDRPDGGYCLTGYKEQEILSVTRFLPRAHCRQEKCVRDNVPQAIYQYPWPAVDASSITLEPGDATGLRSALQLAQSRPNELFTIILPHGYYNLGEELSVTQGNITLFGDPGRPDTVVLQPAPGTEHRMFRVVGTDDEHPLLALNGITVKGGSTDIFNFGAGISASKAGLIVENSIITENITNARGSGIYVNSGFFQLNRSIVSNNGHENELEGCGGGGFTNGGGISIQGVEEAYVHNSTIWNNHQCRSGGLEILSSNVSMIQNTVAENEAGSYGGGMTVSGSGGIRLKFNTIVGNSSGKVPSGEDKLGGGMVLHTYTGNLIMEGNILADNLNHNGNPDSTGTPDDFSTISPSAYRVKDTWRNVIKNWTLPVNPADFPMESSLIGVDPMLGPLVPHGQGFGYPSMPTYFPSTQGQAYRAYDLRENSPTSEIPRRDQRGYRRLTLQRATPGSVDPDAVDAFAPVVFLEAEDGSPLSPLQVHPDPNAEGGSYVEVAPGTPTRGTPPANPTTGVLTLPFQVPETGSYTIWGRVIAPTTGNDSFWVRVDGGEWVQWNNITPGGDWHWDDVHDANNGNEALVFDLEVGIDHTLEVSYRENGTRLDQFAISNDPTFDPAELEQ